MALLLAGCASQPEIRYRDVQVYVKEPCITAPPVRPTYHYGKGKPPSDKEMALILAKDFEAAETYGSNWEAAAAGCLVVPKPPAQASEPAQP
jgi:hypothetical protein